MTSVETQKAGGGCGYHATSRFQLGAGTNHTNNILAKILDYTCTKHKHRSRTGNESEKVEIKVSDYAEGNNDCKRMLLARMMMNELMKCEMNERICVY